MYLLYDSPKCRVHSVLHLPVRAGHHHILFFWRFLEITIICSFNWMTLFFLWHVSRFSVWETHVKVRNFILRHPGCFDLQLMTLWEPLLLVYLLSGLLDKLLDLFAAYDLDNQSGDGIRSRCVFLSHDAGDVIRIPWRKRRRAGEASITQLIDGCMAQTSNLFFTWRKKQILLTLLSIVCLTILYLHEQLFHFCFLVFTRFQFTSP